MLKVNFSTCKPCLRPPTEVVNAIGEASMPLSIKYIELRTGRNIVLQGPSDAALRAMEQNFARDLDNLFEILERINKPIIEEIFDARDCPR